MSLNALLNSVRINVTVQLDTNKVRGFLFPAQAHLFWPTLTRHARVKFPLTQIGNTSVSLTFSSRVSTAVNFNPCMANVESTSLPYGLHGST